MLNFQILSVDWFFEFHCRSVNNCFLYFVGVLQALVNRHVSISSRDYVPV